MGYRSRRQLSRPNNSRGADKVEFTAYHIRGGHWFAEAKIKIRRNAAGIRQADALLAGETLIVNHDLGLTAKFVGSQTDADSGGAIKIYRQNVHTYCLAFAADDSDCARQAIDTAIAISYEDKEYGHAFGPALGTGDVFARELPAVVVAIHSNLADEFHDRVDDRQHQNKWLQCEKQSATIAAGWMNEIAAEFLYRFF